MIKDIRLKLILISLFSIIPSIIFIFYLNSDARDNSRDEAYKNLTSVTNLYAAEHSQVVENAKHLLIALSASNEIQTESCDKFLESLLTKYQRYSNFGIADKNGNVYCSAVPNNNLNIKDTIFFKDSLLEKTFSISQYRISPATNNQVLSFSYPYKDGVIYSSIDINWLNNTTENISDDSRLSTLVLDINGVILTRFPYSAEWIGKVYPDQKFIDQVLKNKVGISSSYGVDDIKRVNAFKNLADGNLYVVVGIPENEIFRDSQNHFFVSILLLILVVIISFNLSWIMGSKLVLKDVSAIEETLKLKDDFMYLMSHQIRTPLTSIKWFSEILLSKGNKDKNIIRDIHTSAKNVINLVSMVLDITKIESGKINFQKEKINLSSLLSTVKKDLSRLQKSKELRLKINMSKEANEITVDTKLFKQVFINIIGNAYKYSKFGGLIIISAKRSKGFINISVKDNGIGIPDEEKPKIFKKFSRGSNATKLSPDGSGLGLYLTKLIIEAHGGSISFKSSNDETVFNFSIPK